MPETMRHMALPAGAQIGLASVRHNLRHRWMFVRIPVGRRERIVDLRRREPGRAPLDVKDLASVGRPLLARRHRVGPRRWGLTRLTGDANGRDGERDTGNRENLLHRVSKAYL